MAKWFWSFLLVLMLGIGGAGNGEKLTEENEAVWNYSGISEPEELVYIQQYEMCSEYETRDPEVIRDCIRALKEMKIEGETDLCATDAGDILSFVMEDGSSYAVSFEAGILVRDGKRYTVTGFDQLSDILRELSETRF